LTISNLNLYDCGKLRASVTNSEQPSISAASTAMVLELIADPFLEQRRLRFGIFFYASL
jgi:hypothetical protein